MIAGKIEQEFSSLEIYVYDPSDGNLFVHHDIILSSFPVCIEWVGASLFQVEQAEVAKGNYGIVGLMTDKIEIWDLDIKDPVQPEHYLTGHSSSVTSIRLHE
jgi:periodic tryptophan protein 1